MLPSINAPPQPLLAVDEAAAESSRPGLLARVCPALGKGSIWGTTINLCTAIMGAGCLSLPQAVASLGVAPFGVLIVFTAAATHYSIVLLVAAMDATGCFSFEELSAQIIGKRTGHLVELCIIIFQYGTLVAYTIAVGDVLSPLLALDAVRDAAPWLTRDLVMVFFWALFMLPLSFVTAISSLQITSLFGQLSLLYLVLAVAVHSALDVAAAPDATFWRVEAFGPDLGAASSAAAVIMFAFTCQINVPSLYQELAPKSPAGMRAVSTRAVGVCVVVYVVIGLMGYANFPTDTQGNILNNYCVLDPERTSHARHAPNLIPPAFGAIVLTVLMAYPINVYPTRQALEIMCCPKPRRLSGAEDAAAIGLGIASTTAGGSRRGRLGLASWATLRHVVLTLAIATVSLLTAIAVPKIDVVFALMGGTCSAYVNYILPSAVAWRLAERVPQNRTLLGRCAVLSLGAFGIIVGGMSTVTTIIGPVAELFEGQSNATAFDPCAGGGGGGGGHATLSGW